MGSRLRSLVPGLESEPGLDEIDDEVFDRATAILEANGDELSKENIQAQAKHLLELETAEDGEIRLGVLQDETERSLADRDIIAPHEISEHSGLLRIGIYGSWWPVRAHDDNPRLSRACSARLA